MLKEAESILGSLRKMREVAQILNDAASLAKEEEVLSMVEFLKSQED
jgi:hypothetical protein